MKFLARFIKLYSPVFAFVCVGAIASVSQTTKPKTTASKPKPPASKPKPGSSNSKSAPAKTQTTPAKAKLASSKPKSSTAKSSTAKSKGPTKPTPKKPKPVAIKVNPVEKVPTPDEKTEWEKAIGVADPTERITALRSFLAAFPETEKVKEAHALVAAAASDLGNAGIAAGDIAGAALHFKMAANEVPVPMPDKLFEDALSRFAANLYFRGARAEAYEIASILEQKAADNANQLLSIANFYMSVENGSAARRVADHAIKVAPSSSAAYQTLGLASRIDFRLDASAAAYAKALELDPESLSARRGLAEMKRSTGKADEAVALYREILEREPDNLPAHTGLTLALFDSGKTVEAEAELSKAIDSNSGNVILLAGAAYWYAANNDGDKAVSLSLKAIAADPRFIWSHIALARGYLSQNNPSAAEKTLLAARRYGNFPTLEYEIASVRLAAGYYREAADELERTFKVHDGVIRADLGGRVTRESKNFTELIGFERRASIFAPTAADSPENAARLTALLELRQELEAAEPRADAVARAADEFIRGDDKMKVHRQLYAANRLLEKKAALPKVLEISKAAIANVDAGLEVENPTVAVMADELYESRKLAATRGESLNVPPVPRQALAAILRGEIEEITGWTLFQTDVPDESVVRLKRAVSVLPPESAWWRSSTWRLGVALARTGKDAEALGMYIRSYKGGTPNFFSYRAIEDLYEKVNGNTVGLDALVGPKPESPTATDTIAQNTEQIATPVASPEAVTAKPEATPAVVPNEVPTPSESPTVSPTPAVGEATPTRSPTEETVETPTPEQKVSETPEGSPSPSPSPTAEEPKPTANPTPDETIPIPTPFVRRIPSVVPIASPSPSPTPTPTPEEVAQTPAPTATPESSPSPTPQEAVPTPAVTPTPESSPSPTPDEGVPTSAATPTPEVTPAATPETAPPTPEPSPRPQDKKPTDEKPAGSSPDSIFKELFPPVVIAIPKPPEGAANAKSSETPSSPTQSPSPAEPAAKSEPEKTVPDPKKPPGSIPPENTVADGRPRLVNAPQATKIEPCELTAGEESITLPSGGGDRAVIIRRVDDGVIDDLTATTRSPQDISIRRLAVDGLRDQAMFILGTASEKTGVYQVTFKMPCGKKEIVVRVR